MKCRILVVCRDPFLRAGLRTVLQERLGAGGVLEARSYYEAIGMLNGEMTVAVVENSPEALVGIRTLTDRAATRVVVFSRTEDPAALQASLVAGAMGFCTCHGEDITELLEVVRKACQGAPAFDTGSLRQVIAGCRGAWEASSADALTSEELDVLQRIAAGESTKRIAVALSMSEGTVKGRIAKAMHKLKVSSRAAAVAKLLQSDGALSVARG
jgi:DNA-binding NarL/FixJ family response regulator